MSDHLIAEANRHAKALPKMTLPTTKPNAIDYARLMREWEFLDDRNKVLERENAALREDWQLSERRWIAREKEWAEKTVEIEKKNAELREILKRLGYDETGRVLFQK